MVLNLAMWLELQSFKERKRRRIAIFDEAKVSHRAAQVDERQGKRLDLADKSCPLQDSYHTTH